MLENLAQITSNSRAESQDASQNTHFWRLYDNTVVELYYLEVSTNVVVEPLSICQRVEENRFGENHVWCPNFPEDSMGLENKSDDWKPLALS